VCYCQCRPDLDNAPDSITIIGICRWSYRGVDQSTYYMFYFGVLDRLVKSDIIIIFKQDVLLLSMTCNLISLIPIGYNITVLG